MIAASMYLAIALYFSAVVIIHSANGIANKTPTRQNLSAIIAAIAWGAFYYFTHA